MVLAVACGSARTQVLIESTYDELLLFAQRRSKRKCEANKATSPTARPMISRLLCALGKSVVLVSALPVEFLCGFDCHRHEGLHRNYGPDRP